MTRKLLTALGALTVLGLIGASLAGLLIVKDRVRVVLQADEATSGPDPVALLRDDVKTVQGDLAALTAQLPASFEQLGTALDERAGARHAELLPVAGDVAALRQEVRSQAEQASATASGFEARLARLEHRLESLAAAAEAKAAVAPAPSAEPVAQAEPEPEIEVETRIEVEPKTAPAPEPAPPVEAAKPVARSGGFLSFSVPVRKFRFDVEQEYVLVPDLCRVGFDAKSTLHDFSGVTSKVAGSFTARLDDPAGGWSGSVRCEAATLKTGVEGRDDNMREHLDTEHHEQIEFTITKFVPDSVDAEKLTCKGAILGRMSIHGVTKEVRMPIDVSVDSSRRVVVEGQMPLLLSDYEVEVPSQLGGTIKMEDEVKVWIALRARVRAGGGK